MADSAWPALLSALSKAISTNLSDMLFSEVVSAFVKFTILCGTLGLDAPRDAFLATLGKYAVPPAVVSAMQTYAEPTVGSRSASATGAEALGLVGLGVTAITVPPALSDRNLACLKNVVAIAQTLSSSGMARDTRGAAERQLYAGSSAADRRTETTDNSQSDRRDTVIARLDGCRSE